MDTPADINLTRALTAESSLRGTMLKSQTARNFLFGGAALALGIGVGVAAIVWSNNQKLDIEALKTAISQMPELKVATIAPLTLEEPAPLKLEEPAPLKIEDGIVTLEQGSTVRLDPNASVDLKGTVLTQAPSTGSVQQQAATQPQQTNEGDAIKQEVTVFNKVAYGNNKAIVTGWRYENGASKTPSHQYCYYSEIVDGVDKSTTIALDRVVEASARKRIKNVEQLIAKCVWYRS